MDYQLVTPHFLKRAAKLYRDKVGFVNEDKEYTYGELYERINRLSHGYARLGVKPGDRVAYLATNMLEMYEGFFGVGQVDAIHQPLNTRLSMEDLTFILSHSGASVIYVDKQFLDTILEIRERLPELRTIITNAEGVNESDIINYEELLATSSSEPYDYSHVKENDIASLLYTSGTTGNPKGVMLTHRNNYLQAMQAMHHLQVTDQDVLLHTLPMFHVNGWGSPFYYTANGAKQVSLDKVRPNIIFDKIEKHGVTIMHFAPTVLNMLLEYASQHDIPKPEHHIRIVVAGAAPPLAFIRRAEKELGWEFIQVYGMTELSPLVTISKPRAQHLDQAEDKIFELKARTGYDMIGGEIKVVNDKGEEVAKNGKEIGEIIYRGNNMMKGYWNNPEATAETIKDGWLHTGDLAVVFPDESVLIVDRKKDIIISGGENISSLEVEDALYEHEGIKEVAVIAAPHEKWGETPMAIVVKREGYEHLTAEDIIEFSRSRLAHFKAPTKVQFVDELPKNANGKILKHELRRQFVENRIKNGEKLFQ